MRTNVDSQLQVVYIRIQKMGLLDRDMVNKLEIEALEVRSGLPEPLRILLETYPREAWEADPGFSALIRFWLDRHLMFRRLLDVLQTEAEAALDKNMDAQTYASHLSRYGSMFVGELHGHHSIEDQHYFPQIKGLEKRVEHGFDILDADHHALDAHINGFAASANAVLEAVQTDKALIDPVGQMRDGLGDMARFLDRHLTDEEELVVPILLKHGSAGWS